MSTQDDDAAQVGLFPAPERRPKRHRPTRTTAPAPRTLSMKPHEAREVLAEVAEKRFGIVDNTDRIASVNAEDHSVAPAAEEDLLYHLINQGYVERCPARDTFTGHTARWSRPISPLRLTKHGRTLLQRWSALAPVGDGR